MKRLSVTSEGFFNGGKAKPSYNKTRGQYGNQAPPAAAHQSGVSLPRLPPPESGPKAKGTYKYLFVVGLLVISQHHSNQRIPDPAAFLDRKSHQNIR